VNIHLFTLSRRLLCAASRFEKLSVEESKSRFRSDNNRLKGRDGFDCEREVTVFNGFSCTVCRSKGWNVIEANCSTACARKMRSNHTRAAIKPENKQSSGLQGTMCDRNARHKYLEEAQIVSLPFTYLQQKQTAGCRTERAKCAFCSFFPFASP
jgi:hypothetical protein